MSPGGMLVWYVKDRNMRDMTPNIYDYDNAYDIR